MVDKKRAEKVRRGKNEGILKKNDFATLLDFLRLSLNAKSCIFKNMASLYKQIR